MKLSFQSRFSSGSSENILKSCVNDEFKQRSFQNSQILNQFKRKEISKKSIESQNPQAQKSRFTSGSSTTRSSTGKTRAPLRKISAFDLNTNSNNIDSIVKNKDSYSFSYIHSNNSDNDDLNAIESSDYFDKSSQGNVNKQKDREQFSNAPHVSFSGKVKTSQNGTLSFSSDRVNNSNKKLIDNNKGNTDNESSSMAAQSSKNRINEDMSDIIADLEKKNFVLMTDLRENCQLLNSLQKRLDQSTKDIISKSNEIVSLKKQISELKAKSNGSKEIANESNDDNQDQNENQDESSEEKIHQLQLKIEELGKSNEELIKNNEELVKNNEELAKCKEELMKEKELQKEEINKLNSEKDSLTSKINELKAQNDELQLQETESNHNQELSSLILELKQKNAQYENQVTKLQQENQNLMQLKADNEKLKTDNEKFKADNEKFKADNEKLKAGGEKLKADNDKLKQLISNCQNENEKLNQDISKLQKENEILNENQQNLLNQNVELQKAHQAILDQNKNACNDINQGEDTHNDDINSNNNNHNSKSTSKYQMYDAYSDLSENESDDNHSMQDIVSGEKSTPSNKQNRIRDPQLLQQQCFIDDFESQSYASDFSSEFSFTDASDRNEIMNSPKASIIQQLLAANQKNKALKEANAKLESVASTVMSDYTEALNKIQALEKKKPLSVESIPSITFEITNNLNNDPDNEVLKQKINEMKIKFQKLNDAYSQLKSAHLESFSSLIQKRQESFKKEIEEMTSLNASHQLQYDQIQTQLDSLLS